MRSRLPIILVLAFLVIASLACMLLSNQGSPAATQGSAQGTAPATAIPQQGWQEEFNLGDRQLSDQGEARYFILTPGFQAVLESRNARLVITVLAETKLINGITTRVVEEREEKNGNLYEVSRNFYAIDAKTGDTFYFGEEVDFYENNVIIGHKGEWLAYEGKNKPGLIMPGDPIAGMKYYQELAPGAAMDRAEVIDVSAVFTSPAGEFKDCLITKESSAIEPITEQKTYCPGIGLVQDQSLLLTSYGNQGS
jgi:hypothetical protein